MYYARIVKQRNELVFSLLAAADGLERRFNGVLSNVKGVSFTEYCLLKQLSECHSGSATRVDLAQAVHLTPSAVTRALKPLEKIGYVVTVKGERDARQSIAALTPAGLALLEDANALVNDEIAGLDIPEQPQSELLNVLNGLTYIRR